MVNWKIIDRQQIKAGAASVIRLSNGFFLCAVWVDSQVPDEIFEFYLSQTTNFDDGFQNTPICRIPSLRQPMEKGTEDKRPGLSAVQMPVVSVRP